MRYTKSDLEQIVSTQLENLNAMHDLITIMKTQNVLLHQANERLKQEVNGVEEKKCVLYNKRRRISS
jgi:hypothetical protein